MNKAEEAALKAYPKHKPDHFGIYSLEYSNILSGRKGFQEGYELAEKDTIERACKWLFSRLPILLDYYNEDIHEKADRSEFIKLFRTQMEEEQ